MGPLRQQVQFRVFVYFFLDFCANFGKSYLELGVSHFGEPNFVGFLMSVVFYKNMKCTVSGIFKGE